MLVIYYFILYIYNKYMVNSVINEYSILVIKSFQVLL